MSGGMWEAVEAGARKVGMGKAEGRRGKRGSRKEKGGKEEEEETEKWKSSGSKESSGRMGNMGRGRGSGKVGSGSKEVSTREVP